jgi:hypothetical protein
LFVAQSLDYLRELLSYSLIELCPLDVKTFGQQFQVHANISNLVPNFVGQVSPIAPAFFNKVCQLAGLTTEGQGKKTFIVIGIARGKPLRPLVRAVQGCPLASRKLLAIKDASASFWSSCCYAKSKSKRLGAAWLCQIGALSVVRAVWKARAWWCSTEEKAGSARIPNRPAARSLS